MDIHGKAQPTVTDTSGKKPEHNNEKSHGQNHKKMVQALLAHLCNYVWMKNYRG